MNHKIIGENLQRWAAAAYQVSESTIKQYWLTNPAMRESLQREFATKLDRP